ncbi:MAG: hypothetical protein WKG07_10650 [Hymenobacter sp.]
MGFDSYYLLQDGLIYPGLELKRLLKPIQFIYNIRDYVMGVPYFQAARALAGSGHYKAGRCGGG